MADNFLEAHREAYEIKKAKWQLSRTVRSHFLKKKSSILKPEDESL